MVKKIELVEFVILYEEPVTLKSRNSDPRHFLVFSRNSVKFVLSTTEQLMKNQFTNIL